MKLCKRRSKIENTSWWTSKYFTRRRLSHEKELEELIHILSKKEGKTEFLREIVKGEIRSMIKELLEEIAPFRNRGIALWYPIVFLDGVVLKIRRDSIAR